MRKVKLFSLTLALALVLSSLLGVGSSLAAINDYAYTYADNNNYRTELSGLTRTYYSINATETEHWYGTATPIVTTVSYSYTFLAQRELDSVGNSYHAALAYILGARDSRSYTYTPKTVYVPANEYTGLYTVTIFCPRSKVTYKTNGGTVATINYAPDTELALYYAIVYTP